MRNYQTKSIAEVVQFGEDLAGAVRAGAILEEHVRWHLEDLAKKVCFHEVRKRAVAKGLAKYRNTIWST